MKPSVTEAVFVTGATGYVGGRLVPRLLEGGRRVVCLVRSATKLSHRAWKDDPRVSVVEADLEDTDTVALAMRGCEAAYYLVHSMTAGGAAYREHDRRLAAAFAAAAGKAGVRRIIYLGGLGETGENLSEHLASRREVERELASGTALLTVLRAAMIIGSGSASFEILRYLVERLPVMVTPRWVKTECQPVAVNDVIHYLVACLDAPETAGQTIDIGGPDIVSYRELMQITAGALGLRRRVILPLPVLTPRLSSLWIHLVTPVPAAIARPLAEGLRNRVVCRDERARRLMPHPCLGVAEAIDAAVRSRRSDEVPTAWFDAGPIPGDPDWSGGTAFEDRREVVVEASPEKVFQTVCGLGGSHGWCGADWLWRLRGILDRLVGGPGLQRGRRHPDRIGYGDALDFWRVTRIDKNSRLDLCAEMKLPGEALLSFRLRPEAAGACRLLQVACFRPRGLGGLIYWWAVKPLHGIVFRGMLTGIKQLAERESPRPTSAGVRVGAL